FGPAGAVGAIHRTAEGFQMKLLDDDSYRGTCPTLEVAKSALHAALEPRPEWREFREHCDRGVSARPPPHRMRVLPGTARAARRACPAPASWPDGARPSPARSPGRRPSEGALNRERPMTDNVTVAGLVATPIKHTITAGGLEISSFRLASSSRRYDRASQAWV